MTATRRLLALVLSLFASVAWSWEARPEKVADGVYAFIGEIGPRTPDNEGMNANTGFVVTKAGVVVVDSGSSRAVAAKIHAAIRAVTKQPVVLVINTGGQDHRWLGNGYFIDQGIPVLANEKTVADNRERGGQLMAGLAATLGEGFAGTRIAPATETFGERRTLVVGGQSLELIHAGGGHTPGDTIVWLPKQRVAFSGDLVYVDRLLGVLPMSHTGRWLASFAALEALAPRLIVPGHGRPATLAQAQAQTRDYLAALRGHMKKAVAAGDDIQAAIASFDDKAWSGLAVYPELRGPNANRAYLELEAE